MIVGARRRLQQETQRALTLDIGDGEGGDSVLNALLCNLSWDFRTAKKDHSLLLNMIWEAELVGKSTLSEFTSAVRSWKNRKIHKDLV